MIPTVKKNPCIRAAVLAPLLALLVVVGLHAQTPPPATTAPTAAPAAPAAPSPAAPTASWTFTPSFASQYMFRGVRLGGPSFQPSLEYDYGNLAVGIWANTPIADKVPGQSDPELDPYGSYKFTINDSLSIQPGFTWYTYVNAKRENGFYKTTFEPNLAVNYTVGAVTFTPKLYYDMVLKGPTAELNASFAVPLKELGSELDFAGTVGTYKWTSAVPDQNPDVHNWGDYWLVGVSMPFQIVKDTQKLTIGVAWTEGSNNNFSQKGFGTWANTAAVSRGVFTVSYAITF